MNLTAEKINALASRKGVRAIAVQNFLGSLWGLSRYEAGLNLAMDARLYKWNAATVNAIREGINLACK